MPSSPTELDSFSRLTAVQTPASVTKNKDKLSEETASKEVRELGKKFRSCVIHGIKIISKAFSNLGGFRQVCAIYHKLKGFNLCFLKLDT
jgi:hypothetical protein